MLHLLGQGPVSASPFVPQKAPGARPGDGGSSAEPAESSSSRGLCHGVGRNHCGFGVWGFGRGCVAVFEAHGSPCGGSSACLMQAVMGLSKSWP